MTTLFGYDEVFLKHDTGVHPERPERLTSILAELSRTGQMDALLPIEERVQPDQWISLIHAHEYVARVAAACRAQLPYIDVPDSAISSDSFGAARQAVSLVLAACDAIISDGAANGFCAVRPPGHHAEHDRSMGFCLFNNVAVACRYLQKQYGLRRILILDWDVHHGNGTQHTFESDDTVFYCSLHQDPATCYPGTGWPQERGVGSGRGYNLNLPMPPGADDALCLELFEKEFIPAASQFDPDFVLISAGFDAHREDPLAQLNLTERAYEEMTQQIKALAQDCCNGRLLSVLEGGYDLAALSNCISTHVNVLM